MGQSILAALNGDDTHDWRADTKAAIKGLQSNDPAERAAAAVEARSLIADYSQRQSDIEKTALQETGNS